MFSSVLKQNHRLRMFEYSVLMGILFLPNTKEKIEGWRNLHDKDFIICTFTRYSSDQTKKDEMSEAHSTHGEIRN
jgi:hypothetical protein